MPRRELKHQTKASPCASAINNEPCPWFPSSGVCIVISRDSASNCVISRGRRDHRRRAGCRATSGLMLAANDGNIDRHAARRPDVLPPARVLLFVAPTVARQQKVPSGAPSTGQPFGLGRDWMSSCPTGEQDWMVPSRSSPLHTTLFNMSLNPTNHLARVSTAATSRTTTSWLGGRAYGPDR